MWLRNRLGNLKNLLRFLLDAGSLLEQEIRSDFLRLTQLITPLRNAILNENQMGLDTLIFLASRLQVLGVFFSYV